MNYRVLKTERQFKDTTGYDQATFELLLKDFEQTYEDINGQGYESYIEKSVTEPPKLKTLGDVLFFVLFQMKNDLIFGSLGAVFGMSGGTAHNNFERFSALLAQTLEKKSDAQT